VAGLDIPLAEGCGLDGGSGDSVAFLVSFKEDFPAPGIAAIELATADITGTADYLRRLQVAFAALPDGRLMVPAHEANGTILFFAPG